MGCSFGTVVSVDTAKNRKKNEKPQYFFGLFSCQLEHSSKFWQALYKPPGQCVVCLAGECVCRCHTGGEGGERNLTFCFLVNLGEIVDAVRATLLF
jgi:hypothetical protein